MIAFVVALVSFREPPFRECQIESTSNSAYRARLEEPLDATRTVYHLRVTHQGQPVSRARVCMRADLEGMSGMGTSNVAREVARGRYEVSIHFEMPGSWRSTVIVDQGQQKPVAIPFDVRVS